MTEITSASTCSSSMKCFQRALAAYEAALGEASDHGPMETKVAAARQAVIDEYARLNVANTPALSPASTSSECRYPACACRSIVECKDKANHRWRGMSLKTEPGAKVIYTDRNGWSGDTEHCRAAGLIRGEEYEVTGVEVGLSTSAVYLKGFGRLSFNTVCFVNVD